MAADWVKMRTDLYRDPRVIIMADCLMDSSGLLAKYVNQNEQRDMCVTRNVIRNATVGSLVTVWGVMRLRGKCEGDDLVCDGASLSVIDDMAEMPGFGEAMASVGWVEESGDGLVFPRFFEDYNVNPDGKTESKAAVRQRNYRERHKQKSDDNSNVTRDVTVTPREEKRREEKKEEKIVASLFVLPDWIPSEAWNGYVEMRKKAKKPMTQRACELKVIELEAFRKAGHDLAAILNKSTSNNWTDIYAPKAEGKPSASADLFRGVI